MDKFIIRGGTPLRGTMRPSGNKNAALPMMAACLLTKEPVVLNNMPDIQDGIGSERLLVPPLMIGRSIGKHYQYGNG